MKKIIIIIIMSFWSYTQAQTINENILFETPDSEINIYIVSQGYTTGSSMNDFHDYVNAYLNLMWSLEPYASLQSRFRIITVEYLLANQVLHEPFAPFQFQDVDDPTDYVCDPGSNQYLDAECYSDFYTRMDNLTTQLSDFNEKSYIVALFNNDYYTGGGGKYAFASNYCNAFGPGGAQFMDEVVMHEFGHTFAILGDEYNQNFGGQIYDSTCTVVIDPDTGLPQELGPDSYPLFHDRNVTDKNSLSEIPWKYAIDPGTAIPTCVAGNCPANVVGLFEGANYTNSGWYRGEKFCLMRALGDDELCDVCQDLTEERIKEHLCETIAPITEDFIERHQYITHWRKSENPITSTSDVGDEITVQFVSEQEVILEDGFIAVSGSDFRASIGDCDALEVVNNYRRSKATKTGVIPFNQNTKKGKGKKNTTSIKDSDIKLFPNPVSDILHISSMVSVKRIRIFDMIGKEIASIEVNSNYYEFDFSEFNSGMYTVKIESEYFVKTTSIIKK